jgi:hypothetical protein
MERHYMSFCIQIVSRWTAAQVSLRPTQQHQAELHRYCDMQSLTVDQSLPKAHIQLHDIVNRSESCTQS